MATHPNAVDFEIKANNLGVEDVRERAEQNFVEQWNRRLEEAKDAEAVQELGLQWWQTMMKSGKYRAFTPFGADDVVALARAMGDAFEHIINADNALRNDTYRKDELRGKERAALVRLSFVRDKLQSSASRSEFGPVLPQWLIWFCLDWLVDAGRKYVPTTGRRQFFSIVNLGPAQGRSGADARGGSDKTVHLRATMEAQQRYWERKLDAYVSDASMGAGGGQLQVLEVRDWNQKFRQAAAVLELGLRFNHRRYGRRKPPMRGVFYEPDTQGYFRWAVWFFPDEPPLLRTFYDFVQSGAIPATVALAVPQWDMIKPNWKTAMRRWGMRSQERWVDAYGDLILRAQISDDDLPHEADHT